jgi:hypothetical protein
MFHVYRAFSYKETEYSNGSCLVFIIESHLTDNQINELNGMKKNILWEYIGKFNETSILHYIIIEIKIAGRVFNLQCHDIKLTTNGTTIEIDNIYELNIIKPNKYKIINCNDITISNVALYFDTALKYEHFERMPNFA